MHKPLADDIQEAYPFLDILTALGVAVMLAVLLILSFGPAARRLSPHSIDPAPPSFQPSGISGQLQPEAKQTALP